MDLSEILISEVQKRPALWNLRGKAYHNRVIVERDWKKVAEITGLSVGASKVRWKNLRDHFRKELLKQNRPNTEGDGEQRLSKWIHFDSLLFLKHVLKPRRMKGKLTAGTGEDAPDPIPEETEMAAGHATSDDSGDYEFTRAGNASIEEQKEQTAMVPQLQTVTGYNSTEMSTAMKLKRELKDGSCTEDFSLASESQLLKLKGDMLSLIQLLEDDDLNFLRSLLPYMKSLPPIRKLVVRSQFQNLLVQEMINCQNHAGAMQVPSNPCAQVSAESSSSPDQD
ncbi:uncharacterized protein [Hetaerina americana]|uniref:uncharacterized protein n=1 Tax=Hetaerina americana TaxID=62018 RepID=UPI003A7F3DB1